MVTGFLVRNSYWDVELQLRHSGLRFYFTARIIELSNLVKITLFDFFSYLKRNALNHEHLFLVGKLCEFRFWTLNWKQRCMTLKKSLWIWSAAKNTLKASNDQTFREIWFELEFKGSSGENRSKNKIRTFSKEKIYLNHDTKHRNFGFKFRVETPPNVNWLSKVAN